MKISHIIFALFVFHPTLSFSQWDVKNAMESGMNAMENHDYMTAVLFYTRVIDARPNNHKALYFRGKAKYQLGDYSGCESDESDALSLNPYYYDAYELRGLSREKLGKFILASKDFSIASANSYNRWDLSEHEAFCLLKGGDYQAADSLSEKLLRHLPETADYYILRAKAKYGLKDWISSETMIDKAIEQEPFNYEALTIKANFQMKAHHWEKAVDFYTKALYINSKNPVNIAKRGLCRAMAGDLNAALSDIRLLHDISPGNKIAEQALLCTSIDDFKVLSDSIIQQKGFEISLNDLYRHENIDLMEIVKNYELLSPQYLSDYQHEAYQTDETFKNAYQLLLDHKYKESVQAFTKIIQNGFKIPEVYYNRAYANFRIQNYEPAHEDLTKAINLRENFAEAYYNRGLVKLYLNDIDSANMDFSMAGQYGIGYAYKIIVRIKNNDFE